MNPMKLAARCSVLLGLACSSCFFYDSRWGQQKQAQTHAAQHLTPQQVRASSASTAPAMNRTLRLRVYATPAHAAAVVDWQRQFSSLLECANGVFSQDFGVHFEATEFRSFRPQADEEKLNGLLDEVTQADDAKGVDWVVVLARSVPKFAVSADDLGVAPLLGNHLAMRAMSDAHEYEAIQKGFSELSEEERQKLYRVRKHHKLCTVFMHELAHTLGVPHERTESSLMSPRYQVTASGFSDETSRIIRASLQVREADSSNFMDPQLASELSAALSAEGAGWEPHTRDQVLAQLASYARQTASTSASETGAPASPSAPVSGLSAAEQATYDRARAELAAGRAESARTLAAPLIAKHADLAAVQDLRCNIAMGVGADPDTLSTECAAFSPFGAK